MNHLLRYKWLYTAGGLLLSALLTYIGVDEVERAKLLELLNTLINELFNSLGETQ